MTNATTTKKSYEDLTYNQQKACYTFAKMYVQRTDDVAPHLDTFVKLAYGEISILEAERVTGLVLIDHTRPTLF